MDPKLLIGNKLYPRCENLMEYEVQKCIVCQFPLPIKEKEEKEKNVNVSVKVEEDIADMALDSLELEVTVFLGKLQRRRK